MYTFFWRTLYKEIMIQVNVSCCIVHSLTNCNVCAYFVWLNLCNALYCAGSLIKLELRSFRSCTYCLVQFEIYRMLDYVEFHDRWRRTELSNVIIYIYIYISFYNMPCSNLINLVAYWTQFFVAQCTKLRIVKTDIVYLCGPTLVLILSFVQCYISRYFCNLHYTSYKSITY